jgi:hypothetical protein
VSFPILFLCIRTYLSHLHLHRTFSVYLIEITLLSAVLFSPSNTLCRTCLISSHKSTVLRIHSFPCETFSWFAARFSLLGEEPHIGHTSTGTWEC